MVSPPQRRRAVQLLQERLGVSQRRACAIVGQHRSTQRYEPAEPDPDRSLRAELRGFAESHPRWGYRRAHAVLQRQGWAVNRKKVQRLWRQEGLRVPPKRRKRQRLGDSDTDAGLLRAQRPDHVWALDFQFDVTASGRKIKILHVLDEFTRESLADLVDHSIDADATVGCLDKVAAARGRCPENIRCDNGPELTANALRDWCRFTGQHQLHRAGIALAEPVGGVIRRPHARRAAVNRAIRQPPRSTSTCRRLANRLQQLPPPLSARHAHPSRIRRPMGEKQPEKTLITSGPKNGVRSITHACMRESSKPSIAQTNPRHTTSR